MEWKPLEGRFRQLSANLGGVWALTNSGDLFYRIGTFENCQTVGSGWFQVHGSKPYIFDVLRAYGRCADDVTPVPEELPFLPYGIDRVASASPRNGNCSGCPNSTAQWNVVGQGKFSQVSVGWNAVWAVDTQGTVWFRDGIDIEHVVGNRWVRVPTDRPFKQVSVGRLGHVWAIDQAHDVYYRVGACLDCPGGCYWKKIGDRRMSQIDVGKSGVWAVDENKEIFHRMGTYGESPAQGYDWVKVAPDVVLLQQVSSGGEDMMLGVTRKGELFMRAGMCHQSPTGSTWKRLPGEISMVDVYGYTAWAVDFQCRPVYTPLWPYSQEAIRPLISTFY